jgi:hypothetical protein
VQIIVVLDDHARTQLGGRDRHCWKLSPSKINAVCWADGRACPEQAQRLKGGQAAFFRCTKTEDQILHSAPEKGNLSRNRFIP